MKKNILIGLLTPLFYYFGVNIIRYTLLAIEYPGKYYAALAVALLYVLPALPGVALIFLLIRDSLEEFFNSLGICFLTSLMLMLFYHVSNVDLMLYTWITGYAEFSLGDGFLFVMTFMVYLASCLIGSVIAYIITCIRQRNRPTSEIK